MNIKSFEFNLLQENCYVVSDDTQEAIIIDCGAYFESDRKAIIDYLRNMKLKPVHLLCTHGHFDHAFGNNTIYEEFGLKPEIHADDASLIEDLVRQCSDFGIPYAWVTPPLGHLLTDGETITFGHHQLKVLHTPGHSKGSVIFYCQEEGIAFSGDTLFRMGVGRTDLAGGSWKELMQSLQTKIALLPANTVVYPGHGPKTTIGEEVSMNPYFR
jgi:glyoxylase-like metal-dependent hydrolase (beta-lactamase superfamily II)